MLAEDGLKGKHRPPGLLRMSARTDTEKLVRIGQTQLFKEDARHLMIIVLTGVHQYLLKLLGIPGHGRHDRCYLHEIRPSTDDMHDFHPRLPLLQKTSSQWPANAGRHCPLASTTPSSR